MGCRVITERTRVWIYIYSYSLLSVEDGIERELVIMATGYQHYPDRLSRRSFFSTDG